MTKEELYKIPTKNGLKSWQIRYDGNNIKC